MELPSKFQIDEDCSFIPTARQIKEKAIAEEPLEGKVVAIRFTEAKIFYDILSDYYAEVFKDVPSEKVFISSWASDPSASPVPKAELTDKIAV